MIDKLLGVLLQGPTRGVNKSSSNQPKIFPAKKRDKVEILPWEFFCVFASSSLGSQQLLSDSIVITSLPENF